MKTLINTFVIVLMSTLAAGQASAHHSAVQFDFRNTVLVEGKVMEARFVNPHMHLVLEVKDATGTRNIQFEGHSRNNMARQGLRPDLFAVGDTITIRIAPMKTGDDGGYVTAVRGPDGTEVGNVTGAD
jgi:hypothetical protein